MDGRRRGGGALLVQAQAASGSRHLFEQPEEHVGVKGPLVGLVDNDNGDGREEGVAQGLADQQTVRAELNRRGGRGPVRHSGRPGMGGSLCGVERGGEKAPQ